MFGNHLSLSWITSSQIIRHVLEIKKEFKTCFPFQSLTQNFIFILLEKIKNIINFINKNKKLNDYLNFSFCLNFQSLFWFFKTLFQHVHMYVCIYNNCSLNCRSGVKKSKDCYIISRLNNKYTSWTPRFLFIYYLNF